MFYCENCADENEWPLSAHRSLGNCEMCGSTAACCDVPSRSLPMAKAKSKSKRQVYHGPYETCVHCPKLYIEKGAPGACPFLWPSATNSVPKKCPECGSTKIGNAMSGSTINGTHPYYLRGEVSAAQAVQRRMVPRDSSWWAQCKDCLGIWLWRFPNIYVWVGANDKVMRGQE